jgi:hypothetical protein
MWHILTTKAGSRPLAEQRRLQMASVPDTDWLGNGDKEIWTFVLGMLLGM